MAYHYEDGCEEWISGRPTFAGLTASASSPGDLAVCHEGSQERISTARPSRAAC